MSAVRVKLTKSFIDQLELTPAIYRDVDLIGFAVRINTTYKTYVVEKRVHGKNVRATVGVHGQLTLAQARAKAQEMLLDMSRGINPTEVKKNDRLRALGDDELDASQPTLVDAYAIYCVERELAERTRSDYESVINNYLKDWREIKLKNITRKMIQDRHQSLSANSKAQANMAMRVFRAIYNFSIEHYLDSNEQPILPTSNPVSTLTAKRQWNKIKRRKTYINEDKLPTWVNSVLNFQGRGQQLETNRDFLLTLVLTGFRSEECASIAWDAIDLKYGFITSVDPKNGDPHTLPMGDFLWQLMKKRRRYVDGNWVFPSKKSATGHISNIAKVRDKINADCDVQFTFHDLRRTFASIAEGLDYGRYTIKRLLNHREDDDRDVTAGYIQVSDKKIRQAMNEIEQVIFADQRANLIDEMKKK